MSSTTEEVAEVEEVVVPERRKLPRARTIVVGLVVVALAAGAGWLGWQVHQQQRLDAARSQAESAGREYATDLATYDYHDLNGNFTKITANATGKFAQQYKQVSDNLTKLIQQMQATSKGAVVQSGISAADTDHAVLVLFVDQTITNTNSPQPRVDRNRMRINLVHQEDRWLIDDVQLL